MMPPPDTLSSLTGAFSAFFTVAIHAVLAERNVYPAESFINAKAYNFPIRQSRHPLVCQWINDAVAAVEKELLKGIVTRVAIVIFDISESDYGGGVRPLERFVIDLRDWPVVPPNQLDTPIRRREPEKKEDGKSAQRTTQPEVDMEEQFRAVLSQLSTCSTNLKPIPDGCTFTVCIELKDEADPPLSHSQPWIPSEPGMQRTMLTRGNEQYGGDLKTTMQRGGELGGAATVPVRTVDAGEMAFEMWIEEGKAKDESWSAGPSFERGSDVDEKVTNTSSSL